MDFDSVFTPVSDIPSTANREDRIVGALNMLAASGQLRVQVNDLLGMDPKTWSEKCRGRGWKWSQKKHEEGTRYYIEVIK